MKNVEKIHTGNVRGFFHGPAQPMGDGLVLTHGAGGNCEMPLLVAVANAFAERGVAVLRCDLAFRQKRPKGPPTPSTAAADRAGLREAISELRTRVPGRVFVGGQSYGGRQASMLVSDESGIADGLLLLSYPLHPPGRPDSPRTAHFASLQQASLFVHGSRDPFGTIEEMRLATSLIPARRELIEIAGAGHDLLRGRFDVSHFVVEPFFALFSPGK